MSKGMFADWYECPNCYPKSHKETRHYCYTKTSHEGMRFRTMRVVFCEICGMMRFQSRSELGKWVFGVASAQPIEVPL